ncbi:LytTR family transcriptional regulator DNA-binding domain-containing protein [Gordoniibacillus kamchatkensis]|uniref:LytTR family transcriptional regulator DNA-binding domain-containing protein n=1 Tax=Gordoniibacillus kamchatkensis TaxID=1590651 RepID=UPI0006975AA7|nr:LytTR family transcriptional regulator DNA-binding domain-containing protein [Paenibacillus sp. VKM B-2647]
MQLSAGKDRAFEEFVLERDILYFRVGTHELVSFHGGNFNWRKRLSAEELERMTSHHAFFRVNGDCYVNTGKIASVKEGTVHLGAGGGEGKSVAVSKLREGRLKEMLNRSSAKEAAEPETLAK